MFPFVQSAIALEFDMFNINCIGIIPCSGNEIGNSITNNSNQGNDYSDNSDNSININDSFNPQPTNICGNAFGSQTQDNTTIQALNNTCQITDSPPNFPPSTLDFASLY